MNPFRRLRDAVLCVALLAVPFFVLNANLKDPTRTNAIDRAILAVSAPIQGVASHAASWTRALLEDYILLVDVQQERRRLQQRVDRLQEENLLLQNRAAEAERLAALVQLREHTPGETIAAHIIGKEISSFFRVLRIQIDRGERDRLRADMPVVAPAGLVGQVQRAFSRHADIMLTTDRRSRVSILVQRSGAIGILQGTGDAHRYVARIEYLGPEDRIQEGDLVHTSGLGQRFPAGLLVGRVSRVLQSQPGVRQEVEVIPSVDFGSLQDVLILTEGPSGQDAEARPTTAPNANGSGNGGASPSTASPTTSSTGSSNGRNP